MRFTFDRDAMAKEITAAQEIISNKSPISILSNILLIAQNNTLTIKATDSSVNFVTKIPVDIQEEGTTTIHCDKFKNILSTPPSGEYEFIQNDISVLIKPTTKDVKFKLKSMASEKFPEVKSTEGVQFFEVPSKDFKEMISQTIFAVSEDSNRYFMTGVFLEKKEDKLIMVATNGRRLSYVEKEIAQNISDFPSAIIPTKILYSILKNAPQEGNIFISVTEKIIFIKFGNYEYSSLLLEGQFPNYERAIPQQQTKSFEIDKKELEGALKHMSIMINKKEARLILKIQPGKLTLISPENEEGEADESIPCQYSDEEVTLAINNVYLEEPLRVINTERIKFEFTDATKAITLKAEPASDYFHVIMTINFD